MEDTVQIHFFSGIAIVIAYKWLISLLNHLHKNPDPVT
jgi:hypothetical protein